MDRGCYGTLHCVKQSSKVDARLIESFNIPFSGLSDGLLLIIAFDQCLEPGAGQRQERQSEQSLE